MKKVRVRHKLLEKLSIKTGIPRPLLSDYMAGRKVVPTTKVFFLEDMTGIPARVWAQGTPDQIRAAVNNAMSEATNDQA